MQVVENSSIVTCEIMDISRAGSRHSLKCRVEKAGQVEGFANLLATKVGEVLLIQFRDDAVGLSIGDRVSLRVSQTGPHTYWGDAASITVADQ